MSATPSTPPEPPAEQQSSVEHLLLRFGLVTLDQLSAALREQTETGTPFAEVLVRDGVVSAEDLARVAERTPAAPAEPAPAPVQVAPEPEPEPVPEPAQAAPLPGPPAVEAPPPPVALAPPPPALAPEPVLEQPIALVPEPPAPVVDAPAPPAAAPGFVVRGHLVTGEEIEIASLDDAASAQRIARDAMRACARDDGSDWPILNGRYVRPESIVSIEVAERP